MVDDLRYEYSDKTILDLISLWELNRLNLEPGFQRQSVWSVGDRRKLIESLLDGYPIPAIFLYRREESGRLVYDVIDGKQRLETIFMFVGAARFKRSTFDVPHGLPHDDRQQRYT